MKALWHLDGWESSEGFKDVSGVSLPGVLDLCYGSMFLLPFFFLIFQVADSI